MGKLEYFRILLDRPDSEAIYFPGEELVGSINFRVTERFKVNQVRLSIDGTGRVSWTERAGKSYKTYTGKETYLSHKSMLMARDDESDVDLYLEPRDYSFPFRFTLPNNLPTSFEHHYGRIRYSVNGTIDIPWSIDKHAMKAFSVINMFDLNELPNLRQPAEMTDSKTLCCGPCRSGPVTGEFMVRKTGFVPGETIICHASIDNRSSSEINPMRVSLVQRITFHGEYFSYEKKKQVKREVVSARYSSSVPAHTHEEWTGIKLQIPPVCSSTVNLQPRIIEIAYALIFTFEPVGMHVSKNLLIPVAIGTKPLMDAASASTWASQPGPPPPYSYQLSVFAPTDDQDELPPDYDDIKGDIVDSNSKTFRPHYMYFYSLSS